jgi:NTP pyrophosphatase (non-canonical NTP hydrolase)
VPADELGDALFALLALCAALDVDAEAALETSLAKYEERLTESGGAGSGQ